MRKKYSSLSLDSNGGEVIISVDRIKDLKKILEQDDEFDWKLKPINSALKLLGVNKKDGMDEFDTIGLVRYRSNHDFNK